MAKRLPDTEAAELRSDVVRTVKRARLPKPNITKAERAALRNLQKDDTIIVLPADKGRATVLMNTDDYKTKISALVSDTNTYSKLKKDPNTRFKTKLVNIFKQWKKDKSISERLYWRLYPNAEEAPKLYGTPKIHKPNAPLRPIVSCCGSITYNAARYLATVLSPLVGTQHSVKNSKELVDKLRGLVVPPGQKLVSYDVKALFTSVPVDQALNVIECKLRQDLTLPDRSELNGDQLIQLLEYCLTTTYFVYGGEFYQQVHGAAMGSPVSPIVANLYMEHFESIALSTAPRPPSLWFRYDTFVLTYEDDVDSLTSHIINIDDHIQFTTEPETQGKLPFLDLCVTVLGDTSTKITISRKPAHTDQYLNFNSHHPLIHKRSVVRTLTTRAQLYVTTAEDRKAEISHVRNALRANNYKEWALDVPHVRSKKQVTTTDKTTTKSTRPMLGLPYIQGLSEQLSGTYQSHGVYLFHRPSNTICSMLVHPKDKTPKEKLCGTIYHITCDDDTLHSGPRYPVTLAQVPGESGRSTW